MTLKKPNCHINNGNVFIMFVSVAYAAYVSYNVTYQVLKVMLRYSKEQNQLTIIM